MKTNNDGGVASLELCKELFGLSDWSDTNKVWSLAYKAEEATRKGRQWHISNRHIKSNGFYPAYGLGYLIRKLPAYSCVEIDDVISASHSTKDFKEFTEIANTPEDAVAKLAIELFKQGILKKGTPQ
jgi:hypothetical protein